MGRAEGERGGGVDARVVPLRRQLRRRRRLWRLRADQGAVREVRHHRRQRREPRRQAAQEVKVKRVISEGLISLSAERAKTNVFASENFTIHNILFCCT